MSDRRGWPLFVVVPEYYAFAISLALAVMGVRIGRLGATLTGASLATLGLVLFLAR